MEIVSKHFLKTGIAVAVSLIGLNVYAAPMIVVKSADKKILAATTLPPAIKKVINEEEVKQPDLYKIIAYQAADHYVLYFLSSKSWKATKIRIDLDRNGKITDLMDPYFGNNDVQLTQDSPAVCPDNTVQFVAISAYPGVGGVDKAMAIVSEAAKKKYKTMTILSESADAQTYENWFSCPNLKGFYSIGHGSNSEMIVGNETIVNYSFFANKEFNNKYKNTTVVLNSCELFNSPFGSQMIFGNSITEATFKTNPGPNAYEFMGGYIDLPFVDSELSSACFVAKALGGAKMDYDTLKQCIGNRDMHYQGFGLAYPGRYLK